MPRFYDAGWQIGERVKNTGAVFAAVGGGAHSIEQHLEARLLRAHFVEVHGNEYLIERYVAALQFGEDARKPLRMLVEHRQVGAAAPVGLISSKQIRLRRYPEIRPYRDVALREFLLDEIGILQ
jgi:hypothetical protein